MLIFSISGCFILFLYHPDVIVSIKIAGSDAGAADFSGKPEENHFSSTTQASFLSPCLDRPAIL
jgi:hypothetical protein